MNVDVVWCRTQRVASDGTEVGKTNKKIHKVYEERFRTNFYHLCCSPTILYTVENGRMVDGG